MERTIYFYGSLVLGIPLFRITETAIIQTVSGMTLQLFNLNAIGLSVFIGLACCVISRWTDPLRGRTLWILPLFTSLFACALFVAQSFPVLIRFGYVQMFLDVIAESTIWGSTAFVATLIGTKLIRAKREIAEVPKSRLW